MMERILATDLVETPLALDRAAACLAAAIFSPWMNVPGSVLANYWKKRPAK